MRLFAFGLRELRRRLLIQGRLAHHDGDRVGGAAVVAFDGLGDSKDVVVCAAFAAPLNRDGVSFAHEKSMRYLLLLSKRKIAIAIF